MLLAFTIVCAVLPSVALFSYFRRKDAFPEPRGVLLTTFILGVLTVIPVLLLGIPGWLLLRNVTDPQHAALLMAFGLAAIPEEFFKFLVVFGYCSRHREFDEPMDGMIYGAVASLGFATLENILYVLDTGLGTAVVRAFTSVPSHAFLGAIMGYFVARAKFDPRERGSWLLLALIVPILLHGLYDYPLIYASLLIGDDDFSGVSNLSLALLMVPFAVLIFECVVTVLLIRHLRSVQLLVEHAQQAGVMEEM